MDLTTPNREAIRLLREAQDLMNDKGRHWTKGTYRRHDDVADDPSYCAVGALVKVGAGDNPRLALEHGSLKIAAEALSQVVRNQVDLSKHPEVTKWKAHDYIVAFNDDSDRTWPDVRAAFQAAIRRLKSGK